MHKMQNKAFKGNSLNRGPVSDRRQQARSRQTNSDVSQDGREALLVQRSNLVNSGTGLKAKCFVDDERVRVQNANGRSTRFVRDSRNNHGPVNQVAPLCQVQGRSKFIRQVGSDTKFNNVTNNSNKKRSYFEPYDARRSPRVQRNNIQYNYNNVHANFTGANYMATTAYHQQTGQQPQHQYFVQPSNTATAVAPNGQLIYIPIDDSQYEVKNINHDLEFVHEHNDLPPFDSSEELDRNEHLVSSPRPVHLKGGLSQDSGEDSGDSSDVISYGEPDTDTGSEDGKCSDESEYVDNCVSDVLKTIAKSVQDISIEESENIVQRALQEFEDTQEATQSVSSSETTQHKQINFARPEINKAFISTKRSDITNNLSSRDAGLETEPRQNCFGMIGHDDNVTSCTTEEAKPSSSEVNNTAKTHTNVDSCVKSFDNLDKDVTGNSQQDDLQNDFQDPSIIVMSASQRRITNVPYWQQTSTTDSSDQNIPQCEENKFEFKNGCFAMNNVTYLDTFDNSELDRCLNESKPEVIANLPEVSTNQPDVVYFQRSMKQNNMQNDWIIPQQQNSSGTNDASYLNSFDSSNMKTQALVNTVCNPEVSTNQPEVVSPQPSMGYISMLNDWLLSQQSISGTNNASSLNSFDSSNIKTQVTVESYPEVCTNRPEVVAHQRSIDHISRQNELLHQPNINKAVTNDASYLNSFHSSRINCQANVSNTDVQVSPIQPETVYSPHCIAGNYSPIHAQNEWLFIQQNVDSVDQMLSPLAYGPMEEDAVYMPGNIMIDGQGYFRSSDPHNGQNETLYIPDNCTFQEHQPVLVPTMAPACTYFIHDACPPPPPEVVCHPLHKRVSGEVICVPGAAGYEPQMVSESNDREYTNQACAIQQPPSPAYDVVQSASTADYQYCDNQPVSSSGGNSVTTGQTIHELWDSDVRNEQQNAGHETYILSTNQPEVESTGQYASQSGQFYVSYDEECVYTDPQSGLSYPAIHMTDDCLITVIFREGICLEISADKSMRLVNHEKQLVAAMTGNGERACVIHPAARIYQSETIVNAALYSNRRAKMSDEFITFGNDTNSYMFDQKVIKPVDGETNFMDLSGDESVKFLYADDGMQPNSEKMKQRNLEILTQAHFWKHGKRGSTVIINGTKVVQSDKGDVTVYCGPIKFMRMNPKRSIIRLKTQLFEADIETNWNVKLTRGHLALNVSHLGLIVSNGKIKGCIDNEDKLQAFTLPDHRVLMLGQAISQHRPGVPSWSRRRNHNRRTEPEGDHSAYAQPIVMERVNRPQNNPELEWR